LLAVVVLAAVAAVAALAALAAGRDGAPAAALAEATPVIPTASVVAAIANICPLRIKQTLSVRLRGGVSLKDTPRAEKGPPRTELADVRGGQSGAVPGEVNA
jgi:hypothetical protein